MLAIAFVVLAYYVVIYVLGMLGIGVPDQILRVVFVILALLAIIGALQGRFDNWWKVEKAHSKGLFARRE